METYGWIKLAHIGVWGYWIGSDLDAGASRVYLHHLGPDMEAFIETFGAVVLPKFD